jgi:hypothetical protein
MAHLLEKLHVTACTAGDVQDKAVWLRQMSPFFDPV